MQFTLQASVLSVSLLLMGAGAVTPAIANISAAFPDTSPGLIMQVATLPSITMVPVSLAFGKLTEWFTKRVLFFIAAAIFLVAGLAPAFLNDITLILIMRAAVGVSLGILMPLATVLVTDFFHGAERERMMGLQSAATNLSGIIFQLLGGILCVANWHNTFYAYAFAVVVALFVYFFLPEPERLSDRVNEPQDHSSKQLPASVYLLELALLVYNVLLFAFFTNIAIQIVGEKLGDAASVGIALTVFTMGGLITGLLFGKLMQVLRRFAIVAGWIVTGLGLILLGYAHEFPLIIAGCFIAGMGFAVTIPATFVKMSMLSSPAAIPFAFAFAYSSMGVGQFMAPIVSNLILTLLQQEPGRFASLFSGMVIVIIGLGMAVRTWQSSKIMAIDRDGAY